MAYNLMGEYVAVSDETFFAKKLELQNEALGNERSMARFKLWLDDDRSPANQLGEEIRECWVGIAQGDWRPVSDASEYACNKVSAGLATLDHYNLRHRFR